MLFRFIPTNICNNTTTLGVLSQIKIIWLIISHLWKLLIFLLIKFVTPIERIKTFITFDETKHNGVHKR